MVTRREWLGITAGAAATLACQPRDPQVVPSDTLIQRAIPSTGEMVPGVGLGSAATFSQLASAGDVGPLKEVFQALVDGGGTVFDTAPAYGRGSVEEVAGAVTNELGIADKIFWATKVNVAGRGGNSADPARARRQIEASFGYFDVPTIDLMQVHNLGDVPTQLGILKELKQEGRVRYIGVTSTRERQYEQLVQIMENEPLDFVGIDYAVDNRSVEETILPLAADRGIGVLVYVPFGRTRLWARVDGKELPDWASEFDAATWAQFFIKYALSHPAVTAVTPATSKAHHMVDNLGGGMGRLPDVPMRKRMAEYVDALPAAPSRR